MFGKKSSKSSDLTSPKAVAKSQDVYARIVTGKVKDASKALDQAHGRKSKKR